MIKIFGYCIPTKWEWALSEVKSYQWVLYEKGKFQVTYHLNTDGGIRIFIKTASNITDRFCELLEFQATYYLLGALGYIKDDGNVAEIPKKILDKIVITTRKDDNIMQFLDVPDGC